MTRLLVDLDNPPHLSDHEWRLMWIAWGMNGSFTAQELALALAPETHLDLSVIEALLTRLTRKHYLTANRSASGFTHYLPSVPFTRAVEREVLRLVEKRFYDDPQALDIAERVLRDALRSAALDGR